MYRNLGEALVRVREYCLPIENAKMQKLGYPRSVIGKMLIFERERASGRNIKMIIVNEPLGN